MRFEIYPGRDRKWWWRLKSANGQIVGGSCQGYTRQRDARAIVKRLRATMHHAGLRELK